METGLRYLDVDSVEGVSVVKILEKALNATGKILQVDQEWVHLSEELGAGSMLIDFHNVEIISSLLLGRLIQLQQRIVGQGGRLVICGLQPKVHKVFAITRLTTAIPIAASVAEGLQQLAS